MPDGEAHKTYHGADLEFLKEQIGFAVEGSAQWRRRKAEEYPEDARNERSAGALDRLAERLAALPSEHRAFRDLAQVWYGSGLSATEAQSQYVGRYGFDGEQDAEPEAFLDGLREVLLDVVIEELPADTADATAEATGSVPERRSEHIGSAAVQVTPTIYAGNNANIVIEVNAGSAEFASAMEKLEAVLDLLRGSNEIAPETKQVLEGDVRAGVAVAKSGRANRTYLDLLLFRPLHWIAEKFASSAIGTAASEAVKALIKALFGE